MTKKKHIHFVGVKGVGMTPLAIIAKQAGIVVTGSDVDAPFITDESLAKEGIVPLVGFDGSHIGKANLVITTGAHGGFDNPEVLEAKRRSIPVLTQGQALGEFIKGDLLGRSGLKGISVTGSHGKTTTTAILATIFSENNLNPSYCIGTSSIVSLPAPGHFGSGEYFIAEADEYATEPKYDKTPKFMWQHPEIMVFTNIELDHPDLYLSIDAIREAFLAFANQTKGVLVAYGDDKQVEKLLLDFKGRVITYGFSSHNDFMVKITRTDLGQAYFHVFHKDNDLGEFMIPVFGSHNILNSVAGIVVSLESGISIEGIKKGLLQFKGSKRRAEYIKTLSDGTLVYDDYAHHPTEIKRTLEGFKEHFPDHQLVCIFQPHTYSRTKTFFTEFSHAFHSADRIILTDIYSSLREENDPSVSSRLLVQEIQKYHKQVQYVPGLHEIPLILNVPREKNTILLTMGAGDVYQIEKDLI